jgi:hypothetical protein
VERLPTAGTVIGGRGPAGLGGRPDRDDYEKYGRLVKELNIKLG